MKVSGLITMTQRLADILKSHSEVLDFKTLMTACEEVSKKNMGM